MQLKPVRRPGRSGWYVRGTISYFENGERKRVSIFEATGTENKEQAEAICRQVEQDVLSRNVNGVAPPRTFAEIAAAYVAAGGEARFLKRILAELGENAVRDLTAAEGYGQTRIDEAAARAMPGASAATLRRQWHGPIIAVLNYAGIPHALRRPRGGNTRTYFVRPFDANRIIDAVSAGRFQNPWHPALVTTLFGQGTRLGETLALDGRDDVFLEYGYAVLRDTKNDRERTIDLTPRTIAAWSTLPNLGEPGPLFRRYDGRPYTARANRGGQIRTLIARAVTDAGLDPRKATPHAFRHTWATWHYAQHKDPLRLMTAGGWSSLELVQRYAKLASPALADECHRAGWTLPNGATDSEAPRSADTAIRGAR